MFGSSGLFFFGIPLVAEADPIIIITAQGVTTYTGSATLTRTYALSEYPLGLSNYVGGLEGQEPNCTVSWRVRLANASGWSGWSNEINHIVEPTFLYNNYNPNYPTAPTDMRYVNVYKQPGTREVKVSLAWTDTSSIETSIKLQRSTDGVAWTDVATLPANTQAYIDNLGQNPPVATYYYRTRAYNVLGGTYSAYTPQVINVALLPTPLPPLPATNLVCTQEGKSVTSGIYYASLVWTVPTNSGATGFKIYARAYDTSYGTAKVIQDNSVSSSYDVPLGTTPTLGVWYFKVAMSNMEGDVDSTEIGVLITEDIIIDPPPPPPPPAKKTVYYTASGVMVLDVIYGVMPEAVITSNCTVNITAGSTMQASASMSTTGDSGVTGGANALVASAVIASYSHVMWDSDYIRASSLITSVAYATLTANSTIGVVTATSYTQGSARLRSRDTLAVQATIDSSGYANIMDFIVPTATLTSSAIVTLTHVGLVTAMALLQSSGSVALYGQYKNFKATLGTRRKINVTLGTK